jgi:hypothetical protein
MARYVGGAVMTAVAAGIVAKVASVKLDAGHPGAEALAIGFGRACLVLAVFSACGILLAWKVGRDVPRPHTIDFAAAAAATSHTLPQAGSRPSDEDDRDQDGPDEHGPDQHGPDQHGPDQHGPDQHGPDQDRPHQDGPD